MGRDIKRVRFPRQLCEYIIRKPQLSTLLLFKAVGMHESYLLSKIKIMYHTMTSEQP